MLAVTHMYLAGSRALRVCRLAFQLQQVLTVHVSHLMYSADLPLRSWNTHAGGSLNSSIVEPRVFS